jgi:exosortase/archaeosortase family protein
VILPSCSSLANVSLAILCWVTMSEMTSHRRSISDICWCLSACAAVVAVNVIRMSMMGISDEYYERIHGHLGEAIVNATILIITLVICSLGVKRELYAAIFGDGNRAASDRLFRR